METFGGSLSVYSLAISASVATGGLIPLALAWTKKHLPILLSFSAGLMLGTTMVHLLPEAFALIGREAHVAALAGFLLLYTFEKFVTVHICEALDCEVHTIGVTAIVGLSIHSLTDGIALGSGLLVPSLGFIVFLTIFFHKLPEAFALTSILLHENYSPRKIVLMNALLILMVPIGALLVYLFATQGHARLTGLSLAFAAGTFLHISLSDLLPEVHKYATRKTIIFLSFLGGLAIAFLLQGLEL